MLGWGMERCAECGGLLPESGDCWRRVGELLEVEQRVLDGGEGALRAHYFAIATYQLQHPSRMSRVAAELLRSGVARMLDDPVPIAQLRREVRRETRGVKVAGTPGDRSEVDPRWPTDWAVAAVDVLGRPDSEYVVAVREWAAVTIAALDAVVPRRA
ncbi:hypothetical protein SAMN04244553_3382 [Nocardia amikacinitolerans]|uniref:Uncharacterized protein n=1 Tax=Nocardia amikacinitolerans TaxID=756689 RepID=A0A285LBX2_9NOCA|nr:hypothetical protein [Nocardia amikacinitolerans]SNY81973.1 hypothetical protein SAMN04244553_3382 [Nocardia amikacinitolerans]